MNITFELVQNYDRQEKLLKYLNRSSKHLEKDALNMINNLYEEIIKIESDFVISHGDLISPNIMFNNDKIKFIDWEYISLKP